MASSDSGSEVKCAGCEKTFLAHSTQNKKWCSGSCYQKNRRVQRHKELGYIKCRQCEEYFHPKSIKNILCSERCRTENKRDYFTERWKKYRGRREKLKSRYSNCKHCGINFEITHPNRQYCSDDCRNERKFWIRKNVTIHWSPKLREVTDKDISSSEYSEEIRAFKESGKRIIVFPSIESSSPDVNIKGEDNAGLEEDLFNFHNYKKGEK